MAKRPDLRSRILTAAMDLSASQGWRTITLAEIAAAAKTSPDKLHDLFSSKIVILNGLSTQIDDQVSAAGSPGGDSVRDNLFEILMRRFELLTVHKDGIKAALRGTVGVDPAATLCGCRALNRSMAADLELAGVNSRGLVGQLRTRALAIGFARVLRVWLSDDGEDMGKTMAALDRVLDRLEQTARSCPGRQQKASAAA